MVVDPPETRIGAEQADFTACGHHRDGGCADEFPLLFPGDPIMVGDGRAGRLRESGRVVYVQPGRLDGQFGRAELDAYVRIGQVHEKPIASLESGQILDFRIENEISLRFGKRHEDDERLAHPLGDLCLSQDPVGDLGGVFGIRFLPHHTQDPIARDFDRLADRALGKGDLDDVLARHHLDGVLHAFR